MASQETTPEGLSKSVFIYTLLGTAAFVGAVVVYVFMM